MKYICNLCGYIYDEKTGCPEEGISAGVLWKNVPAEFECPLCGVGKDEFDETV